MASTNTGCFAGSPMATHRIATAHTHTHTHALTCQVDITQIHLVARDRRHRVGKLSLVMVMVCMVSEVASVPSRVLRSRWLGNHAGNGLQMQMRTVLTSTE
jgi:hypothetical protein